MTHPAIMAAATRVFGGPPCASVLCLKRLGRRRAVWTQRLGEKTAMKQQSSGFASFIAVQRLK